MFCKKRCSYNFSNFTGKHPCWSVFLIKLQACNFIKKGTPTQVLSCEFCKTLKNTPLEEHLFLVLRRSLQSKGRVFSLQKILHIPFGLHTSGMPNERIYQKNRLKLEFHYFSVVKKIRIHKYYIFMFASISKTLLQ